MDWKVGLNFYSKRLVIFDLINIGEDFLIKSLQENRCNIYLICKRKKIHFDNISTDKNGQQALSLYVLDDKHEKIKFTKAIQPNISIKNYENGFYFYDVATQKDNSVRDFILYNFLYEIHDDPEGRKIKNPIPTDLEIVYIGQSFGRKIDRTIDYRLTNHEKVQKIAIEILNKGSNEEILIIGIDVETNDMTTGLSLEHTSEKFTKEKFCELITTAKQRITDGQKITIFEASVIKYFKPDLNTEYKETFPSQDFSSYNEIYQTNFNYITLTIDTLPVKARVFSKHNSVRKYIHTSIHSLATNEEKKSLFEFLMNV